MSTLLSFSTRTTSRGLLMMVAYGLTASTVEAGNGPWTMRITPQATLSSYNQSELRDTFFNAGVFLSGDYLEKSAFTLGYNYNRIEGKNNNPEGFEYVEENVIYLSGSLHRYPDSLPGKLTLRLDGYGIQDKARYSALPDVPDHGNPGVARGAGTNSKATIGVISPIVSFINYRKTYALDLGYTFSSYDIEDGVDYQVHQLTPTAGFALGGQADWLQLRGYFIHLSDGSVAEGKTNSAALEIKWTHWFGPRAPLKLHSLGVNALAGKRLLAVDPDAATVFSLADQQNGSLALNSSWKPAPRTSLMLQIGYDLYTNLRLNNDYNSSYVYFNLSQQW